MREKVRHEKVNSTNESLIKKGSERKMRLEEKRCQGKHETRFSINN